VACGSKIFLSAPHKCHFPTLHSSCIERVKAYAFVVFTAKNGEFFKNYCPSIVFNFISELPVFMRNPTHYIKYSAVLYLYLSLLHFLSVFSNKFLTAQPFTST